MAAITKLLTALVLIGVVGIAALAFLNGRGSQEDTFDSTHSTETIPTLLSTTQSTASSESSLNTPVSVGTNTNTMTTSSSTPTVMTSTTSTISVGPTIQASTTQSSSSSTSTSATTTTSSTSSVATYTITTTTIAISNPNCVSTTLTVGNMTIPQNTCTSYSFPNFASENSTLGSSKVLPLVNGAYDFDLIYGTYNASSPSYQSYILSVTGTQHVSGDWQSGYNISYTGNKFLNVTVQYTKPDTYVVSHLAVYNVLDRNSTKSFTPEQQQIIGAAMANSTVQGLMTGPPYYVTAVYPYLGGPLNGTTAVQLLQVNGIRELNINVNTTNMQVVFANAVNNVDGECFYPSGYCLTDPWGVNVDAGLVLPPFYVSVSYPGQWSLKILGSDNATGVSAPFLYNQTFTGEGNMTITVPWFSDTGGTTLFASAQKTDGGTATLSVTVNWLSGWPGDIGDPTTATAGPTASTATVYDYQVEAS